MTWLKIEARHAVAEDEPESLDADHGAELVALRGGHRDDVALGVDDTDVGRVRAGAGDLAAVGEVAFADLGRLAGGVLSGEELLDRDGDDIRIAEVPVAFGEAPL